MANLSDLEGFALTEVRLNLSFLTRTVLIVHNNPELFTEQIAGIVMIFTSVKLNDGFVIEKPNILMPSLKVTILQPLLTTSRLLDITSSGIILIF